MKEIPMLNERAESIGIIAGRVITKIEWRPVGKHRWIEYANVITLSAGDRNWHVVAGQENEEPLPLAA